MSITPRFSQKDIGPPNIILTVYFFFVILLIFLDFVPAGKETILVISFSLPITVTFLGLFLSQDMVEPTRDTIVPELDIADEFSPCQIGLISNYGSFRKECFFAMIADLYVKKIISFEGMTNGDILVKLDQDPPDDLPIEEKEFLGLSFLVTKKGQVIRMSSIKGAFRSTKFLEYEINQFLSEQGIYNEKGLLFKRLFNLIKLFTGTSSLIIIILYAFLILNTEDPQIIFGMNTAVALSLGLFITSLVSHFFAKHMINLSPKGLELRRRIVGLKAYIKQVEIRRINFFEKEFTGYKLIPYAMAINEKSFWKKLLNNTEIDETFLQFISMDKVPKSSLNDFFDDMGFEFSKIASEFWYTIKS